ncbi:uncharacterized protein DEA37_0008469 [Paragonimus westermani]|uniref:PPPDE domain-containing protein n=1 Tax=Paragonimus westermani TaxID=34504 RepID=A0A5J4P0I1_9TREM|nr:uncharacterized protein DEA37_0008469 [Paragonimus westermani]
MMFDVYLYVYDLSFGMARTLGSTFLGKHIEGIWHTSVVVHNKEYFYGGHGISCCPPGGTELRQPIRKVYMGQTKITENDLCQYLERLAVTQFRGGDYRLFDHNCNTFSNHLVGHLTSKQIPAYILDLPDEVASTPLGAALKPALNRLSAGLNNVPQFGLQQSSTKDTNNHSLEEIEHLFRPIFFDEPLPSDIQSHRIHLYWSTDGHNTNRADYAAAIAEAIVNEDSIERITPEHYCLLDLGSLETMDQCLAVCELFRLAIWRIPSLLTAMLTDPNGYLHHLAESKLPTSRPHEMLDLYASMAKLLCNCLGLSHNWPVSADQELHLSLAPVLHICLLLLDHENHRLKQDSNARGAIVLPEHRQIGLALAHNMALCSWLSCDEAMELTIYLIHLAVIQDKSYKQPIEAIYLMRAIYFLVVRFPVLADFARAYNLSGCLTAVLNEITDDASTVVEPARHESSPVHNDTSMDYLIVARLLDYLTVNAGDAV